MKRILLAAAVLGTSVASAQTNVKTLEHELAKNLNLHAHHMPLMFAVSGLACAFTGGGVRAMKVATYEDLPATLDRAAVAELARRHLSDGWSLMVRQQEKAGEENFVWVQPVRDHFRMLVMNLEAKELDLVQMELSPEQWKKWTEEHGGKG
jgi:hypothetical protein